MELSPTVQDAVESVDGVNHVNADRGYEGEYGIVLEYRADLSVIGKVIDATPATHRPQGFVALDNHLAGIIFSVEEQL